MKEGKIVIIDDHKEYALWLQKYLMKKYFDENIVILDAYDIHYFKENKVDLLLLDIELSNQINGIEEAIKIRKLYGFAMKIIFVSGHDSLIQASLKAGPIQFVRKGFEDMDMSIAMASLELWNFREKATLQIANQMVPIKKIVYIESKNHDVLFHLQDQKLCVKRSKLDDWQEQLETFHFIRCHKSYMVNATFIEVKQKGSVILESGIKINITRRYSPYFERQYRGFICNKYA